METQNEQNKRFTTNEFYQHFLENYSEDSFSPNETLQWLKQNPIVTMSWGLHDPKVLRKDSLVTGLIFKVNGHHHKGSVLITLAWDDTYTVRFINNHYQEVKDKLEMVYCDLLQNSIDEVIEQLPTYNQ